MTSSRASFALSISSCFSSLVNPPLLIFSIASFIACLAFSASAAISSADLLKSSARDSAFSIISSANLSISLIVFESSSGLILEGSLFKSSEISSRSRAISPWSASFVLPRSSISSWSDFSPSSGFLPRISSIFFLSFFLASLLSKSSASSSIKTLAASSMASNIFFSTSSSGSPFLSNHSSYSLSP